MITPSFSLTATERVLPKLALDFTTGVLDPRITFTRTTNATHPATYTDANGAVVAATNNQPRFDYSNGVCKGLLIEETRTNSLLNSILAGATTGVGGTPPTSWITGLWTGSIDSINTSKYASGYAFSITTSGTRIWFYQNITFLANTSYTYSTTITVNSGSITLGGILSATLPSGTNTWYLDGVVAGSSTAITSGTHNVSVVYAIGATGGAASPRWGVGTSTSSTCSVIIEMPQLEVGAFPTSYIPTTSAALTRNADVAVMTGTNFSSWFNASEGTFKITFIQPPAVNNRMLAINDGTNQNRLLLYSGTGLIPYYVVSSAGAGVVNLTKPALVAGTINSASFAYKQDSFAYTTNANGTSTDTTGNVPVSPTQMQIGAELTTYLNSHIQIIEYWPQRCTNNEVQAFSKG